MLYQVGAIVFSILLVCFGLTLLFASIRVGMGSNGNYDQLKGVSKSFWKTVKGDIKQPEGSGGMLFNRGVAYSVDSDGCINFHPQAKTNRESLRDTSI